MPWQVMSLLKRIRTAALVILFLFFTVLPVSAEAVQAPEVSAYAAVLYDPLSGTVLYARNETEVLPMASTTKIMTALLAFESGMAEEPVEVTQEMVTVEGSSMGLAAGDVLTLGAIAQGMMMASGNDGANAIALFLGGDAESFAAMMNMRAAEIGMTQTNFVTPSGLDAEGHGSTAYDMALLAAEAMACPAFAETVGQTALTVEFLSPEKTVRYENHNRLLNLYEGCIGVKTGFTQKAGRCLVSAAERDGAMLICVTLNAPDDWNDHMALYDYGFTQFSERLLPANEVQCSLPVVGGEQTSVLCCAEEDRTAVLLETAAVDTEISLPQFIYAPVSAGDAVGTVVYRVNGQEIGRTRLLASASISVQPDERTEFQKWWDRVIRRIKR